MPRLTKRLVESTKASRTDVVVWDTELAGFGCRVRPSGRRTYFLKYRVGGGRGGTLRKPSIGVHGTITCDEARTIAKAWLAEVAKGGDPGADRMVRRRAPSISDLCDRYLKEHAEAHKRPSSVAEDRRLVERRIRPGLGHIKVTDVSRADVGRLHQSLRKTPYEANRALAVLSKALNLAETWGLRPDGSNPCRHVKRFPEKGRERFLSFEEFARLGEALAEAEESGTESPRAIAAIRLLLFTGARLSEVLSLKWRYVSFENGWLRLPESKTGSKTIYLNAPALEVLDKLGPGDPNAWVFQGAKLNRPLRNLDGWYRIRAAADLADVRLHDLRHSFASVGAGAGLSLPLIGKMLGHSQAATTSRYAHLAVDPVQQAVEQVGATIAAALTGDKAEVVELSKAKR